VIVPDLNLLIYASDGRAQHHAAAHAWWSECLNGRERIGLAWSVALGYLRIVTSPRVMERPLPIGEAQADVTFWLSRRNVVMIEPTSRHLEILTGLLEPIGVGGNLVQDAHLAALAVEHGGDVHSADGDFARFSGVRYRNPLVV
jgi:toxin-antitoxin system PIN domain toxin